MGMIHLTGHIEVPVDKRGAIAGYLAQETFQDRAAFKAHQARVKASTSGAFTEGFARTYDITGN